MKKLGTVARASEIQLAVCFLFLVLADAWEGGQELPLHGNKLEEV